MLCFFQQPLAIQHPPSTCYTRSMKASLQRYRRSFPEKDMYDLSQSIGRARTDLKNGDLLCLATSSTFLWSETLGRCMSGKEKLKTLLYPVENHEDIFSEIPEATLTKFSGNGMFLPSIGWALLCSVLCALPIEQWTVKQQTVGDQKDITLWLWRRVRAILERQSETNTYITYISRQTIDTYMIFRKCITHNFTRNTCLMSRPANFSESHAPHVHDKIKQCIFCKSACPKTHFIEIHCAEETLTNTDTHTHTMTTWPLIVGFPLYITGIIGLWQALHKPLSSWLPRRILNIESVVISTC